MKNLYNSYKDKIKIYSHDNSGVAITRNCGIEYSTGEYLFFIDNDDFIDEDYIERFMNKAIESNADFVLGGHKQIENNGKKVKVRSLSDDSWSAFRFLTPWARVIRKQFLLENNIRFLDTKMGEEIYCSILSAVYADKVSVLDYAGYNWRVNKESVSHTLQKGFQKSASPMKLLKSIYASLDIENINQNKREQLEYFYVKYCIWYMLDSGKGVGVKSMKAEYNEIFGILNKLFPKYKKNKLIRLYKPVGEALSVRVIVWGIVRLSKFKLDKLIFTLYSLI